MVDFAPFSRSSIGFDRLFELLENASTFGHTETYPPYNIEKTGDDAYRITLAVAGFSPEELSITSQPNELIVDGKRTDTGNRQYLYRGIAGDFQRNFNLADYVKVTDANLNNGMLSIDLVRELPESMKPRRIQIPNSNHPQIEGKIAA